MTVKILAVASHGGHWEQLMLLSEAFEEGDVTYACTNRGQAERHGLTRFHEIKDYSQTEPIGVARGLAETFRLVARLRPDVVLSTGAAPGLLCLVWGRVFRAKTIWIDSIANSEKLSLSGRIALKFADLTLTQWEHLSGTSGAQYNGSIL